MGLENFVPELWSDMLLVNLRKSLVFSQLTNQDFVGGLRNYGASVKISELGPVAVTTYAKGDTITYDDLDGTSQDFRIDQSALFKFKIDDIDEAQTNPKLMQGAMEDAAYRVSDSIDSFIGGLYAGAGAGTGTTPATKIGKASSSVTVTTGSVITTISYMARYLSDKNVPKPGRWMVVPPWFTQMIAVNLTGTASTTAIPKTNSDAALMNGYVGTLWGFDIFESPNVSTDGTQYRIMAGTRRAIAFFGQISEVETLRLQTTMANAVRGLYIYGGKVVRPDELVTAYVAEG